MYSTLCTTPPPPPPPLDQHESKLGVHYWLHYKSTAIQNHKLWCPQTQHKFWVCNTGQVVPPLVGMTAEILKQWFCTNASSTGLQLHCAVCTVCTVHCALCTVQWIISQWQSGWRWKEKESAKKPGGLQVSFQVSDHLQCPSKCQIQVSDHLKSEWHWREIGNVDNEDGATPMTKKPNEKCVSAKANHLESRWHWREINLVM